ncbi:hypothetical protein EST38_g5734 [Candolleomyces aberdarensis]|uniref:Uncharacterized protein n=1 Tax=Candolleomyces aberdarensis TaxID=2316362 RepID=A0A4Q2DJC1_9AGAR|nr:hypothetical protein EST38_g5734 [Candolleomyces aberdarensis]
MEAGIPVFGSARGVLPMGPNGVPALNHNWTSHSLFTNSSAQRGILSYNYTIRQQGLESSVTCAYDGTSPIRLDPDAAPRELRYRGVCGDGQASVSNSSEISSRDVVDNTRNGLAFMACMSDVPQSSEMDEPTYYLYLQGGAGPGYSTFVGNVTCTVSPMRAETFSATYHSIESTGEPEHPSRIGSIVDLYSWGIVGVKMFDLPQTERDPGYLGLYAATIQGVLEYVVSFRAL